MGYQLHYYATRSTHGAEEWLTPVIELRRPSMRAFLVRLLLTMEAAMKNKYWSDHKNAYCMQLPILTSTTCARQADMPQIWRKLSSCFAVVSELESTCVTWVILLSTCTVWFEKKFLQLSLLPRELKHRNKTFSTKSVHWNLWYLTSP